MSLFGPQYYSVENAFRILQMDGHSPSNTYIGSSQAFDQVLLAKTAEPGDEIHDLPGGLFHVSAATGKTHKIRLVAPKHVFEKSYGPSPEVTRREALEEGSYISNLESPLLKADYGQAADAADKSHPAHTGGIREIDRDPLHDVSDDLINGLEDAGLDIGIDAATTQFYSQSPNSPALTSFEIDGAKWKVMIFDSNLLRLSTPKELRGTGDNICDADLKKLSMDDAAAALSEFLKEKMGANPAPTM